MKFLVSQTYQEFTPKSAENGDFSDIGFDFEDKVYTLRELISYIKSEGFYLEKCGKARTADWFQTDTWTDCYFTGTEKSLSLHIKLI